MFYSAYIPVGTNALLPQNVPPPLLREHRLYQTDWLLRFYGFTVSELLDEEHPSLDPLLDPKCNWAVNHLEHFPVEVNRADKEMLLRVPGIGVTCFENSYRRPGGLPHLRGAQEAGGGAQAGGVFHHLQWKNDAGAKFSQSFIYQNLTADVRLKPGERPSAPRRSSCPCLTTRRFCPDGRRGWHV